LHASIFIVLISSNAPFAYAIMHLHHTESQTENPIVVPEEPEEQLEVQPQEVTEADEEDVEVLPECPDHRSRSFKRGKPWSISLPRFIIIN
jgi:hypothetical protein